MNSEINKLEDTLLISKGEYKIPYDIRRSTFGYFLIFFHVDFFMELGDYVVIPPI